MGTDDARDAVAWTIDKARAEISAAARGIDRADRDHAQDQITHEALNTKSGERNGHSTGVS